MSFGSNFGLKRNSVSNQISVSKESNIRILITGSRDWVNPFVIGDAIARVLDEYYNYGTARTDDPVIVHGDCPTGADRWADLYAKNYGVRVETHPADWDKHGKFAGPKRNMEMVDLGADAVLSFPKGLSKGTRGCTKYAQEAGLKVTIYEGDEYDIS